MKFKELKEVLNTNALWVKRKEEINFYDEVPDGYDEDEVKWISLSGDRALVVVLK